MVKINKMMIFIIVLTIIIVTVLMYFVNINTKSEIYINESKSSFMDYKVVEDKVYINCNVSIENTSKDEKIIQLKASFPDDVDILLQQDYLYAVSKNNNIQELTITPNSKEMLDVVFIGDFAGTNIKHDRKLPNMTIEIIK